MTRRYQFHDFFDQAQKLERREDALLFFEKLIDSYGLTHIAYTNLYIPAGLEGRDLPITTLPNEWLDHYFGKGYFAYDPIQVASRTRDLPTDHGQIKHRQKKYLHIFDERREFGCGTQGIVFPLPLANGERATFNIMANMSNREWALRRSKLMDELYIVAHFFHHSRLARCHNKLPHDLPSLSHNELECLKWAAEGKTIRETAIILSQSERNVRYHLDLARRKMKCATKIQAVAKAVTIGLINI